MALTIMNLVTPKAAAKHELSFNKPTSAKHEILFNKPISEAFVEQKLRLSFSFRCDKI
jgi:hypothetical protein